MKYFRSLRGFAGHLTRVLRLILSLGILLMGFPFRNSVAQEGVAPLLREQERVLTEEQCVGLQTRVHKLSDPSYIENLRRPLDSLEKMVKAAKEDKHEAFKRLREESRKLALDTSKTLLLEKGPDTILKNLKDARQRVAKIAKIKPGQAKKLSLKLDEAEGQVEAFKKVAERLGDIENIENLAGNRRKALALATKTRGQSESFLETLKSMNDIAVESGLAEQLGETLSSAGGLAGQIAFKAGLFSIMAAADLTEAGIISLRDLPKYEDNLAVIRDQVLRAPLEVETAQRRYKQYCSPPPPPPPPPPIAPPINLRFASP